MSWKTFYPVVQTGIILTFVGMILACSSDSPSNSGVTNTPYDEGYRNAPTYTEDARDHGELLELTDTADYSLPLGPEIALN